MTNTTNEVELEQNVTTRPVIQKLVVSSILETSLYSPGNSESVISDVASSIQLQFGLLPKPLEIALNIATAYLNAESMLLHRRTFARLSDLDAVNSLKRWESSRIGAKRDFVRYIRSLALFNYYDHPSVRSRI